MNKHLQGLGLLYYILGYAGFLFSLYEDIPTSQKLFSATFCAYITYQLIANWHYPNEN
jgi:hypothetical protein